MKRKVVKIIIYLVLFFLTLIILSLTDFPMLFDSHLHYENFELKAYVAIIIYRIVIYGAFPLIVTIIEKFLVKSKRKFVNVVLENYNLQFLTYFGIATIYYVFALDKVLDAEIFSTIDIFIFVTTFILTTIYNKKEVKLIDK